MSEKAIDVTRVKRTRNGSPARVICSDKLSPEGSIVALVTQDEREAVLTYYANGKYWRGMDHPLDLVEEPETVEIDVWLNIYPACVVGVYPTKWKADHGTQPSRIACINIKRTVTKGEGLDQ
jgi:hypothetical protein